MLISREQNRFRDVDGTKVSLGQFQTLKPTWLTTHVLAFIRSKHPALIFDPFAGHGSLLRAARTALHVEGRGMDIDTSTGWPANDSLRCIPRLPGAVIVTNPPYLAKHSARRKGVHDVVAEHFRCRPDLYQLALDRCQEACPHVVAIVPETIINSSYPKTCFESITIVEDNPFGDTDCPVCVVCIDDASASSRSGPLVFLGERPLGRLSDLEKKRLVPRNSIRIDFNVRSGRIALRAVDSMDPRKPMRFMRREESSYPAERISASSRLVTFIEIPSLKEGEIDRAICTANAALASFRADTADVLLSPFKGNSNVGRRRRRLDYRTARAILETACGPDGLGLPLFD